MFRQMILASITEEPINKYKELLAERETWQLKVLEFQKSWHRLPAIAHDNLTGVDTVVGLQDKGIEPFGWRKYQQPYLEPIRNHKGDGAQQALAAIGPSPAFIQTMCETFDIPPFYRTQTDVYYPGFDLVDSVYHSAEFLYVIFNCYPESDPWDGGDHFELVPMWEYYRAKDM